MSYDSDNATWGEGSYRPAYSLNGGIGGTPAWPAPPATGATGAQWTAWLDVNAGTIAPSGYRVWYDDPANSGGTGQHKRPPQPPKKN